MNKKEILEEFKSKLKPILDAQFPEETAKERGGALVLFSWAGILAESLEVQVRKEERERLIEEVVRFKNEIQKRAENVSPNLILNEVVNYACEREATLKRETQIPQTK